MTHTANSTTTRGRAKRNARLTTLGGIAVALLTAVHAPQAVAAPPAAAPSGVDDAAGSSRWTPHPPLRHARAGLSVATVGGQILAIGGFDPAQTFDAVETRRLIGRDSWQPAPPLPTARVNLATAVLNGRVYAVGGYDANDDPVPVVETFNPRSGQWTKSLPLPQPRGGVAAASLGGLLYVAGGIIPVGGGEFRSTASMIVYDPARNMWRSVAPMHTARERFRLVAAGEYLYAVGGRGEGPSLASVERYDPSTGSWRVINPMRESRVVPCVVATKIGNQPVLVAVGGAIFSDDGNFVDARRTTEVLDLTTGRWTLLDTLLPTVRVSLDCAVQPVTTILAISGATFADGLFTFLPNVDALTLSR